MAGAKTRPRAKSKSGSKWSPLLLYVIGVVLFLCSSISEKFHIAIADHLFALAGLVVFGMAGWRFFKR